MTTYKKIFTKCKGCDIANLELYEFNDKCIICTQLDELEKKIENLKK